MIPLVQTYSAREVDRLLRRGNGFAIRNAVELGGYFEDGRWHFNEAGIQRWQERRAALHAEFSEQMRKGA